jgi:hypothetical protein
MSVKGCTRRDVLKVAGVSLGGALLSGRPPAARAAPSVSRTTAATSASASVSSLQNFLQANASPSYSLPSPLSTPPQVSWPGPMSSYPAPTTLPRGVNYAASYSGFGGPIRSSLTPVSSAAVSGFPCLAVQRPYFCKGQAQTVGSPTIVRLNTDSQVIELVGAMLANSYSSQTLIVNGQLVPPTAISVSNGAAGGFNLAAVRIDFGSSFQRDIWIETGMWLAYIRTDAGDNVVSISDASDPQITVVGDSYQTYGSNAFGNGNAIALEIGARLGIRKVAVDAIVGSGYFNSGYNRGNLNDRVSAHAADNSNIYLVMAGINDYADFVNPPATVYPTRQQYESAVLSYFQALRAAQPDAVIAVTAPFSPNATLSDASYVQNQATNTSGLGDFPYKSQVQQQALSQIAGPWVWIDVLMGGGWINSSGASGGATGLQWFTGGTAAGGTTATNKPGNLNGGSGAGFGGIASVPVMAGGQYSQAPEVVVSGGSGTGLLLATTINSAGGISSVTVAQPGTGYTPGSGLPTLTIDPTFQLTAGQLGSPMLMTGINPTGVYPLPSFAPANIPGGFSNTYVNLMPDLKHPSPNGVDYLASRLAQSLFDAILAL